MAAIRKPHRVRIITFTWSSSCLLVLNAKYLVCYIWCQNIFLDCTTTLSLVTLKIHPKAPAGHNLVKLQVNYWLPLKTGRGRRGYKHTWQVRTIWARRTIKKKGSKINKRHWKKNVKQEITISHQHWRKLTRWSCRGKQKRVEAGPRWRASSSRAWRMVLRRRLTGLVQEQMLRSQLVVEEQENSGLARRCDPGTQEGKYQMKLNKKQKNQKLKDFNT